MLVLVVAWLTVLKVLLDLVAALESELTSFPELGLLLELESLELGSRLGLGLLLELESLELENGFLSGSGVRTLLL